MARIVLLAALTAAAMLAPSSCSHTPARADHTLTIHYYRYNNDYTGWNVWVWPQGSEGNGYEFGSPGRDGFVTAYIDIDTDAKEFGYIVRRRAGSNDWAEKDTPEDHFTDAKEIWVLQGDSQTYTQKPDIGSPALRFAAADKNDSVLVVALQRPKNYNMFTVYQDGLKLEGTSARGNNDLQVIISLKEPITDPSKHIIVRDESGGFSDREVTMRKILDNYYYGGDDLGLTWSAAQSVFKIWAPAAKTVSVALYDDAGVYDAGGRVTENETVNLHPMTADRATGVWSAAVSGNLEDKYYLYKIEFANGKINWAVDPYARAVSANGQRGAIVNLAATNPTGWRPGYKPAFSGAAQDAILYELHVRDFSVDEESGMVNKGKFLAFTERGTKNNAGIPTGVDHMVNLGITHVHLMPSFDFASVNELGAGNQFNWGYDPQNYNVPEGSYSTNPADPKARIREFKQMVQALHDAGLRVVMDTVYNHTYATGGTPFDSVVPGYYYRTNDFGQYTNGSGCGNEVASERPMVRKFIVDSCLYWAKEYNIDGYRFDLMALIDRDTMGEVAQRLRAEVNPGIIVYGEPWQAGGSPLPASMQTNMGAQRGMGISIFNDRIRGAIKGGNDDGSRGFATSQTGQENGIVTGLRGSVDSITDRASESINYVTCHDNLNLWDKISASWGNRDVRNNPYNLISQDKPLLENDAVRSVLLANGIVLTAQGVPFFQAGDEMLRTKYGNHNSYQSPDTINRIRWENAAKYKDVVDYYAGLIRLRKAHPAFRMDSRADMDKVNILSRQDRLVAFSIGGNANGDSWSTIFVAYNGGNQAKTIDLPSGGRWHQVVDDKKAGVATLSEHSGTVTVPPLSMAVLHD